VAAFVPHDEPMWGLTGVPPLVRPSYSVLISPG
jgi:hypothetical protein